MNQLNDQELDKYAKKAIQFLEFDRCWEWHMDEDDLKEIVKQYAKLNKEKIQQYTERNRKKNIEHNKNISRTAVLEYLAERIMGFSPGDAPNAAGTFRKIWFGRMTETKEGKAVLKKSKTNGFGIFKLALELSSFSKEGLSPFDFACPTGKNSEHSKYWMEYLWTSTN